MPPGGGGGGGAKDGAAGAPAAAPASEGSSAAAGGGDARAWRTARAARLRSDWGVGGPPPRASRGRAATAYNLKPQCYLNATHIKAQSCMSTVTNKNGRRWRAVSKQQCHTREAYNS